MLFYLSIAHSRQDNPNSVLYDDVLLVQLNSYSMRQVYFITNNSSPTPKNRREYHFGIEKDFVVFLHILVNEIIQNDILKNQNDKDNPYIPYIQ